MNKLRLTFYPVPFIHIDQCTRSITSCFRGLFTQAAFPPRNRSSTASQQHALEQLSARPTTRHPFRAAAHFNIIYTLRFLSPESECPARLQTYSRPCAFGKSSPGSHALLDRYHPRYLNPCLVTRSPTLQSRPLDHSSPSPPRRRDTVDLRFPPCTPLASMVLPNCSDACSNLPAPPLSPLSVVQPLFPTQFFAC